MCCYILGRLTTKLKPFETMNINLTLPGCINGIFCNEFNQKYLNMRWIFYTIMHENDDVIRFAGICQNLTNLFPIPSKTGP